MTIAERIRLIRQKRKLSQAELAEKANTNVKSLSRYELGTSIPPADTLKNILDGLGVSADALLYDEPLGSTDKGLLKKFEVIQNMDRETKSTELHLINLAIRDFKTRAANSA